MDNLIKTDLELLFNRLAFPSGATRERTCDSIARLLTNPKYKNISEDWLIKWLSEQKIEMQVVIGICTLVRAKMIQENYKPPNAKLVIDALNTPSYLAFLLLQEIYGNEIKIPTSDIFFSGNAPEEWSSEEFDRFFPNYTQSFDRYNMEIIAKQNRGRAPILRQWSFEWEAIRKKLGRIPRAHPHFWGDKDEGHFASFDPEIIEVFRSAFLRTLSWAVHNSFVPELIAKDFFIEAMPIDFGLWNVPMAKRPPRWWIHPSLGSTDVIDTIPSQIHSVLAKEWEKRRDMDWQLAQASGRVYESEDNYYDLDIYGVLYQITGNKHPKLEDVIKKFETGKVTTTFGAGLSLEGRLQNNAAEDRAFELDDWRLIPLSSKLYSRSANRWQFYRMIRGVRAPIIFDEHLNIHCNKRGISYKNDKGIIKAKWSDWNFSLREQMFANLEPSNGEMLLIKKSYIQEIMSTYGLTFSWLCKISAFKRKYRHDSFEKAEHCFQFGGTQLIHPSVLSS